MKEKLTKSFQSFSLYLWLKTIYLKKVPHNGIEDSFYRP